MEDRMLENHVAEQRSPKEELGNERLMREVSNSMAAIGDEETQHVDLEETMQETIRHKAERNETRDSGRRANSDESNEWGNSRTQRYKNRRMSSEGRDSEAGGVPLVNSDQRSREPRRQNGNYSEPGIGTGEAVHIMRERRNDIAIENTPIVREEEQYVNDPTEKSQHGNRGRRNELDDVEIKDQTGRSGKQVEEHEMRDETSNSGGGTGRNEVRTQSYSDASRKANRQTIPEETSQQQALQLQPDGIEEQSGTQSGIRQGRSQQSEGESGPSRQKENTNLEQQGEGTRDNKQQNEALSEPERQVAPNADREVDKTETKDAQPGTKYVVDERRLGDQPPDVDAGARHEQQETEQSNIQIPPIRDETLYPQPSGSVDKDESSKKEVVELGELAKLAAEGANALRIVANALDGAR
jgi:hypothetical protein